MKTVITLNANGTWVAGMEPADDDEGLVLVLRAPGADLTFPMQTNQALGLAVAFMQRTGTPSQQPQAEVAQAPRDGTPKVPPLPEAETVLPVQKEIRPVKRHSHRHCEVCNEPICLLVKRANKAQGLEQH